MTGRRLGVRLLNVQDSIDPRSLLQERTTNTIAYLAKKKSPSITARLIGSILRNHLPSISLECSSHRTWTLASVIRYPNLKTKLSRSLHPSTHLNALPDGIPPQASRIFTPETARLFSQAVRMDSHPEPRNQGTKERGPAQSLSSFPWEKPSLVRRSLSKTYSSSLYRTWLHGSDFRVPKNSFYKRNGSPYSPSHASLAKLRPFIRQFTLEFRMELPTHPCKALATVITSSM